MNNTSVRGAKSYPAKTSWIQDYENENNLKYKLYHQLEKLFFPIYTHVQKAPKGPQANQAVHEQNYTHLVNIYE